MELIEFINKYWTILAGIVSVIGVFFYTQFKQTDMDARMEDQKENHDKSISELQVKITAVEVKVDNLKDKLGETINLMQQDIREIMTILKRDK